MSSPQEIPRLSPFQRRILGVLVEKAKTTPEAYPLTLNALTTGCNQKSNRAPQMQLTTDQVEHEMEGLRALGVVTEVQGGGRVSKYRHRIYDWLSVDKVEAAVLTELLLRGPQTVGELRGRASRMEAIRDLQELKPILDGLVSRELVISLTPEGRGQMITHALYPPEELERVRQATSTAEEPARVGAAAQTPHAPVTTRPPDADELKTLRRELADLRDIVAQLEERVTSLEDQ